MTRKDFIAIAEALSAVENFNEIGDDEKGIGAATLRLVVDQLAGVFAADNSRFDRARFEIAALPREHARKVAAIKQSLGVK